ncbi:hypothetical protein ACFW2G_27540, partial [Streptomyces sp. NPDC058880]|uniref:hypothetical protein n=2 Tax=unclassified Streptomyces TaxID=2593676 RepID=UPI0036893CF9
MSMISLASVSEVHLGSVFGPGKDEDAVVRALGPLQLSAGRGISIDQVDESVPVHHASAMSLLAFPCGEDEFLAVLPVRVGYELTGEIAVDDEGDLAGEVWLGIQAGGSPRPAVFGPVRSLRRALRPCA